MIAAQDKNTPNGAFHVDVSLLQANLDTAGFWWGYLGCAWPDIQAHVSTLEGFRLVQERRGHRSLAKSIVAGRHTIAQRAQPDA